jgi:hypothetical protein
MNVQSSNITIRKNFTTKHTKQHEKGGERNFLEDFTQRSGGAERAELLFERLLLPKSGFLLSFIFVLYRVTKKNYS